MEYIESVTGIETFSNTRIIGKRQLLKKYHISLELEESGDEQRIHSRSSFL